MNLNDRLEMAKIGMHQKIRETAPSLPDISNAPKEEMMLLILGTAYMMMVELLESPALSWSTASRAQTAFVYRELGKDCMKNFYDRPTP